MFRSKKIQENLSTNRKFSAIIAKISGILLMKIRMRKSQEQEKKQQTFRLKNQVCSWPILRISYYKDLKKIISKRICGISTVVQAHI